MQTIKVASVQLEHADGDKNANFDKITNFVDKAHARGVDIVVFPECCITGYWYLRHLSRDQIAALAEPLPEGESPRRLAKMAAEKKITIGAGLIEAGEDGRFYNTYLVALPDGRLEHHRKLHSFISEFIRSGETFTVFDTPYDCKIGVLVCYDNNIIENVRKTALMGAEVILAPHQTGGCRSNDPNTMGSIDAALWRNRLEDPASIEAEFKGPKGREWLLRWLPSRAHDNGVFLVFSNGVGVDDDEIRTGNAMILDPYGRILAETWKADDDMVIAELDPGLRVENTGQRWMRARRPELYGDLAEATGREVDMRTARFGGGGV